MSVRLLLEALITKSSSLNFLFLIMSKISQVELYRTLIKPLGRNIEDYLKENPEKLVEYYIYHWLRFKEAFPGKSILSLVDISEVLLVNSFHFRFNNLRIKILNKRIKEYKRKLTYEGKRAQQGYKFYCLLKETLIKKYPDLIKWWNVIHAAFLKKKYIIFDGFNFYTYQSLGDPCTLSANYATLYSLKTIKIYQKYRSDIKNLYILNINQKTFKERFEIKGRQIDLISEKERILVKRK